ncbi:MAG: 3-isopropylmalate dehydratase large subunit [Spirochaetales bacterium]|nr:3-isopropylmalate dehydratase large subunit [Spirochaetales bacterium]
MGDTIAQKILADHCGKDHVVPGELVTAKIDMAFTGEPSGALAIKYMVERGVKKVFDPSRVCLLPDHNTPSNNISTAANCKAMREFAKDMGIAHYYEVGRMGVEHIFLHEKGLIVPGDLAVGADSHTTTHGALGAFATGVGSSDFFAAMVLGEVWLKVPETMKVVLKGKPEEWVTGKDVILYIIGKLGLEGGIYKAMEFTGDGIAHLSMDSRFALCNMAVDCGAKTAIFPVDKIALDYIKARAARPYKIYEADIDAGYCEVLEIDLDKLDMQVSYPHSPANVHPVSRAVNEPKIKIDEVFIGSCTNSRMEDMRLAARILKGRSVHPDVKLIVIPGSQDVFMQSFDEGLVKIIVEAGGAFSTPSCGPCAGCHMGVLAAGERCVSTGNRNFQGRMGHMDSEIFLSGAPVAAASAVAGYLASPLEVL